METPEIRESMEYQEKMRKIKAVSVACILIGVLGFGVYVMREVLEPPREWLHFSIRISSYERIDYEIYVPTPIGENGSVSELVEHFEAYHKNCQYEFITTKYGHAIKIKGSVGGNGTRTIILGSNWYHQSPKWPLGDSFDFPPVMYSMSNMSRNQDHPSTSHHWYYNTTRNAENPHKFPDSILTTYRNSLSGKALIYSKTSGVEVDIELSESLGGDRVEWNIYQADRLDSRSLEKGWNWYPVNVISND